MRQSVAKLGLVVLDSFTADVDGHSVKGAGEGEGWLVRVDDGRSGVATTRQSLIDADQERHGVGDFDRIDRLVPDEECAGARYTLAYRQIRRPETSNW